MSCNVNALRLLNGSNCTKISAQMCTQALIVEARVFSRPPVWAASAGSLRSLAVASLEVAQEAKRLTTEYGWQERARLNRVWYRYRHVKAGRLR